MRILYNFLTHITYFHLRIAQHFSKKLKLFVQGRKGVFEILKNSIQPNDKTIWFHCASLGEFEQGVPIIQAVKKEFPEHKIVVTFFSPSGYEIKKNTPLAHVVVYLPMDTKANSRKFVKMVHPSLALFVKYEFWPNYLLELKANNIPTLLISGVFRKDQLFFKAHGGFMRKALHTFNHIFVQNATSEALLQDLNITNVTVSGDTRFDRVSHQIEQDNTLAFVADFKQDSICIVCGSTWPEDEVVLLEYINNAPEMVKFIIAPHKIEPLKIEAFRKKIDKKSVLYSEKEGQNLSSNSVLLIDTIGLLTKIYSYADIAYVGGAMGNTGLHNILEPATFGVPIVIGKHYENFPEAERLQQLAGLFSIENASECTAILIKLVEDSAFRSKTGMICEHFVNKNTGATRKTMEYIQKLHTGGLI
ncbi:3-deoxy-D-manno-octulosonic-acid transferase [Ulvibacter sp. MAR_2010_11]|uniref:3-deoxy-D-manno-octulosonic acid transferase n=1 Tax=Ulvibacter sp. MAR_2010_11 TaxID=1250229 RepID=UPI000C2C76AE|nr:glycosyltransferase N-terminal domain-containing protein [Ulvibacter sp. MAR_2010_11]PKA83319.1 3-deoxy-D-manno-octulosonic-acid transferase [Ulvibacter sp. MAR_2010_11]